MSIETVKKGLTRKEIKTLKAMANKQQAQKDLPMIINKILATKGVITKKAIKVHKVETAKSVLLNSLLWYNHTSY